MRDETYLALMARADRARYDAESTAPANVPAMAYLGRSAPVRRTPEERGRVSFIDPGCGGTRTVLPSGKTYCPDCQGRAVRADIRRRRREAERDQWHR